MNRGLNALVETLRQELSKMPLGKAQLAVEILALLELVLAKREEEEVELGAAINELLSFMKDHP